MGAVGVDLVTVARIVGHHLFGSLVPARYSALSDEIVWQLRMPRVLLGVLIVQGRPLNAVVVGEETALSVGINVRRLRARLLVVISLLTGVMVAVSGGYRVRRADRPAHCAARGRT